MKKLLKYDFFYLIKTHKLTVFAAVFVLFSILSPLTAKYIGEILEALTGGTDIQIDFGTPTVYTAYEQYISDLFETIFFVVLFVSVSIFIRDKSKGLAALIFSKPINRTKYVLSKYLAFMIMITISTFIGYLLFTYYTYFLFDEIFFAKGLAMMSLYLLYLAFISAIAMFFATITKNYLPAISLTFGVYILISIFTIFGDVPVFEVLPGMLVNSIVGVLYEVNETGVFVWNIIVTVLFTLGFLGLSVWKVQKLDIN
ncbi:ABC transporter permease [Candidatus Xianfuyuplasma coldseepsis]|uniref:ABC transporter permease n=1 Tax=Candidatus Xianfuyuplasma coldseepsis TaxID=2782163 RepID=A0A7L7KPY4_9MOLU|nr:hypothetical protein [Xianfuyuplasma coldseepsis]QMS84850.1 ABC transporter permease [Xianfuyuplasma coldseepsis]